jgi:hypothetical protein
MFFLGRVELGGYSYVSCVGTRRYVDRMGSWLLEGQHCYVWCGTGAVCAGLLPMGDGVSFGYDDAVSVVRVATTLG